jgi:hypothetical protein
VRIFDLSSVKQQLLGNKALSSAEVANPRPAGLFWPAGMFEMAHMTQTLKNETKFSHTSDIIV